MTLKHSIARWFVLVILLCPTFSILAQDDQVTVPYFQSGAFNVPRLEGWENQSSEDIAQFHFPVASATIRARIADQDDVVAAVQSELEDQLDIAVPAPVYQGKVNLADGTWTVLVYDIDGATTASVMARLVGDKTIVISLVEAEPETRVAMLSVAQDEEAGADATSEIADVVDTLTGQSLTDFEGPSELQLPSGAWLLFSRDDLLVMGMVFGNDSYVALAEGSAIDLPALADAWNRTILGFFITPDNSNYLALALVMSFLILGALLFSFYWRRRNLERDLAMIAQLRDDS